MGHNEMTATIKYDFSTASFIAQADWDDQLSGSGTTPEEAVENLRFQCNKHELWPKGEEP